MCGRIKRRLNILVETADPFCCFVVLLRLIYNSPETGYDRINELYLIQEIASITTGEKGGLHIGNNKNKKINYFNSFFFFPLRRDDATTRAQKKKKFDVIQNAASRLVVVADGAVYSTYSPLF